MAKTFVQLSDIGQESWNVINTYSTIKIENNERFFDFSNFRRNRYLLQIVSLCAGSHPSHQIYTLNDVTRELRTEGDRGIPFATRLGTGRPYSKDPG